LDTYPEVGLLVHVVILFLIFVRAVFHINYTDTVISIMEGHQIPEKVLSVALSGRARTLA
jgi:hypothetical protein